MRGALTEMKTTKVIIVDDHKLFREGIKRILDFEDALEVVAEGSDGTDIIPLTQKCEYDVIIMDINMPTINGIDATKELLKIQPDAKVIILSIHDDENYVMHALKMGAKGYLLKEMDADTLIEAVKIVGDGGCFIHPKVTHNLVNEYRRLASREHHFVQNERKIAPPLHLLTRRECEVLQMLADGMSNRSVGESLFISEKTVKNHVSNILQKINVNDRTQAVVTAIKNGWVEIR